MAPPHGPNRKRVDRFVWNRGYFHRGIGWARWKFQLCILALVVSGGWLLYGQFSLPQETRDYRYTHGPVANPHAAWDRNCAACHAASSPDSASLANVADVHGRWHEFRCETCHQGPEKEPKNYAPHHANAAWKNDAATDCGSCHRDHQGRETSLVKLPDSDCTQCHRDLKEFHKEREPKYLTQIGRFEKGYEDSHPPFRHVDQDLKGSDRPRTLHFNHAVHLIPGMKAGVWTLDKIAPQYRERFRMPGQSEKEAVVLSCASCHQLDAGRTSNAELLNLKDGTPRKIDEATAQLLRDLPRDAVLPPRAAGAYMLPINYENHCMACHANDTGPVALEKPALSLETIRVPHRAQPKELDSYLRREYLRQLVQSKPIVADPATPKGRDRLDPRIDDDLKRLRGYDDVLDVLVGKAKSQLYIESKNCLKCHEAVTGGDGQVREIVPPNTPAIWFEHAKFNHAAHRSMDCASCHPVANRPYSAGEKEPVSIPGIDNCRQCHAPPHRVEIDGKVENRGGVRHGCTDCHRYHNGDHSLQGLGSPHRDPPDKMRLSTEQLLRGRRE